MKTVDNKYYIEESENGLYLVKDSDNAIVQVCITYDKAEEWIKGRNK